MSNHLSGKWSNSRALNQKLIHQYARTMVENNSNRPWKWWESLCQDKGWQKLSKWNSKYSKPKMANLLLETIAPKIIIKITIMHPFLTTMTMFRLKWKAQAVKIHHTVMLKFVPATIHSRLVITWCHLQKADQLSKRRPFSAWSEKAHKTILIIWCHKTISQSTKYVKVLEILDLEPISGWYEVQITLRTPLDK